MTQKKIFLSQRAPHLINVEEWDTLATHTGKEGDHCYELTVLARSNVAIVIGKSWIEDNGSFSKVQYSGFELAHDLDSMGLYLWEVSKELNIPRHFMWEVVDQLPATML